MYQKRWLMILALSAHVGLLAALPAHSGEGGAHGRAPLQLDVLIEEAVQANPEIKAVRARWEAAKARAPQARSLPDPMLMLGLRNVGLDEYRVGEDPMAMLGVSATQRFPFPGTLSLRGERAEREAERLRENYRKTLLDTVASLKVAYYDLYLVHKSIEIIEKDKDLLITFEKTAEARYAVGKGIQQDVLKAHVEVSKLINRLVVLRQRQESLVALINSILNRPPLAPLGRPAELIRTEFMETLESLRDKAIQKAPFLLASKWAVSRQEASLDLAELAYYPDFSVTAGWNDRGRIRDVWDLRLGLTVPLYARTKQAYGVKEAHSALESAREAEQAARQRVLYRVKDLYVTVKTAQELVVLYEKAIIPQATLSLESANKGYEVGKVDFLTLIDNLITLLRYELEYYGELTRFEQGIARLEAVVGLPVSARSADRRPAGVLPAAPVKQGGSS